MSIHLDLEKKKVDLLVKSALKRVMDLSIAIPALVITAPVQAVTAAAVFVSMGSPILFRQERPGLHGAPFELIKFRSMHSVDPARGRTDDASRLTTVGKFIRSTSLDELPTLWNIVKGDMSLVGPRPLRVKYLDRYSPEQARRHEVRPGLTGLAQVNGRNSISWEERFSLDTIYVDHQSIWLDIQILFKTLGVVFSRKGVSEEGHVTMTEFLGSSEEDIHNSNLTPKRVPAGLGADFRRIVDYVRGGKSVARQANEVEKTLRLSSPAPGPEAVDHIISYARENVPFYRKSAPILLQDLPVVDKQVIKSNLDSYLSDEFDRSKLFESSTSGSTGVPFTVYFDPGKIRRHRANLLGTYRFLGLDPYAPLVHSRSWPINGPLGKIIQLVKGHYPNSRVHHDGRSLADVTAWLRKRRGVGIMGYTAMTEGLMRDLESHGEKFPRGTVVAVIGGSEPATQYLDQAAQRLFGVRASMRYSTMELGIIGVTADDIETYHIDTSSFFVEILSETSDEPVGAGELGRIVVTDLYNRAMPLLRYDTGDLGRHPLSVSGEEQRNLLTDVRGRRLDLLVGGTEDDPVRLHPIVIWRPLAQVTEIKQFQLRQIAIGKFHWVLNVEKSQEIEQELRKILDERVGNIKECSFSYVEEIPVLGSGKRQVFVTEIKDPEKLFKKED